MPHDPRILALRRRLATDIAEALGPMAQHGIAPFYGISQPRMSELNRGIVSRHTLEWLILRVHRMGGEVTITTRIPNPRPAFVAARRAAAVARRAAREAQRAQRAADP